MPDSRQQLSMFVPAQDAVGLERVRRIVDPVQSSLIAAHVTLCREDELADLPGIRRRLKNLHLGPLLLSFGRAEIFHEHGLIMHSVAGADAFLHLRQYVLDSKQIKTQHPHLTLAHPRNPKAPGNSLDALACLPYPLQFSFPAICLIEQKADSAWQILETYALMA